MNEPLLVERDGNVLLLTLNRPAVRNAIDRRTAEGVAAAMDELDADRDLGAAVLTGAGGTFSSGMDLKAFGRGELPVVPGRGLAGFADAPPRKPLIAAVEGYALAGGLEVMLACDLVVAGEDAVFGIPEVKRGLIAAGGGLVRLPGRIGLTAAMELALSGDPIAAPRAHALGLVNRLVEPGTAAVAALELARRIAANGPLATAASKRILTTAATESPARAAAKQTEINNEIQASADAAEGALAFVEKREPVWTGR